jgi:tRNA(fMet)-specific endonuclease VapC
MQYMLDTNICIELIRGRGESVLAQIQKQKVGDIGLSIITYAELEHGVWKSARPEQNLLALNLFCAPLELAPFDTDAAAAYGRLRARLERAGCIIGPMGLLIAAHALALGSILVTNNEREFCRVEGLHVENWRKP